MSSLMEDSDDKEKVEIKDLDSLDNVQENHYSVGQKFLSEFIGCFFLLFIGSGVGVYTNGDIVPVVLANGFVVGALIYIFGRISGAHFNPSVSIPMYLAGKITLLELLYYTIAQLSGGFLGSLFVALCNKAKFDKLSSTKIGDYLINYGSDNPDENKEIDDYEKFFEAGGVVGDIIEDRKYELKIEDNIDTKINLIKAPSKLREIELLTNFFNSFLLENNQYVFQE